MTARDEQSLDTRLLCDTVIEMNISRRNVAIYPRGHSSVTRSLDRAFRCLQKIFELRERIDLSAARDTLIVGDSYLDKNNAVYREFATSLSGLNIACVEFGKGLTKDELYSFHRLLSVEKRPVSTDNCSVVHREFGLEHIRLVPVDYSAFSFEEGRTEEEGETEDIWARYVKGLLDGTLRTEAHLDGFNRVSPRRLAELLNLNADLAGEESYDAVITSYLRKKSEHWLSGSDMKRLISVIEGLTPELKKQFLSASIKTLSRNIGEAEKAMRSVPVEKIAGFLSSIDEQKVFVPRSLKSLLARFSELSHDGLKELVSGEGALADDFLLSPEIMNLLNESHYDKHVPQAYQDELHRIMTCDVSELYLGDTGEFLRKWSDEGVERSYNQLVLELLAARVPPEVSGEESNPFSTSLMEQLELFASIGQYEQILRTMQLLNSGDLPGEASGTVSEVLDYCGSAAFMAVLTGSFRAVGRQKRDEAARLCSYYGALIVPALLDALTAEETQAGRRFLIGLVTHLGAAAIPEVCSRLREERWYVKRNALFILGEIGSEEALNAARPYVMHSEPRVRIEAIRALVRAGDAHGTGLLREDMISGDRDRAIQAISLAGSFGVRALVPEMARMLKKKGRSRGTYEIRSQIAKALGQIGGREAEETLRGILAMKSLLFGKDLERLKGEARKALGKIRLKGEEQKVDEAVDG